MITGQQLYKRYKAFYSEMIDNYHKTFMDRVRMMREARDPHNRNIKEPLTQVAVATALDIIPQNYNKIEHGKKGGGINLSVEHAIRISVLYGCSIDWLITGREYHGEPIQSDSATRQIKQLEEQLSAERQLRKYQEAEIERLRDEIKVLKERSRKK